MCLRKMDPPDMADVSLVFECACVFLCLGDPALRRSNIVKKHIKYSSCKKKTRNKTKMILVDSSECFGDSALGRPDVFLPFGSRPTGGQAL